MSIFHDIVLPGIANIATEVQTFEDYIKDLIDETRDFKRQYVRTKRSQRETTTKSKTALKPLQSINEDEGEPNKATAQIQPSTTKNKKHSTESNASNKEKENGNNKTARNKKRSKDQVEDMHSPAQDKRPKRNASVRAQSNISKQVNLNLTQKLRRDETERESRPRNINELEQDSDKENALPVKIKLEKLSIQPEPMDIDVPQDVQVKPEVNKDDAIMPPPTAPVPKSRGRPAKNKQKDSANESSDESEGKRKSSRSRKQNEAMPPPLAATSARSTRASSRVNSEETPAQETVRPKRTRTKKVASQSSQESEDAEVTAPASPEKPRPKRTRRGKAAEKQQKAESPKTPQISPNEEPISVPESVQNDNVTSPVLNDYSKRTAKNLTISSEQTMVLDKASPEKPRPKRTRRGKSAEKQQKAESPKTPQISPNEEPISVPESVQNDNVTSPVLNDYSKRTTKNLTISSEQTMVLDKGEENLRETRVISGGDMKEGVVCDFDKTVILPTGKYDHVSSTPKAMNETVVLTQAQRDTITVSQPTNNVAMDATVVIEKATTHHQANNMTEDDSLMTDDNSQSSEDEIEQTPPVNIPKNKEKPQSAVKEKVQQFEEMANRVTRTKTRAMAKKEESTENHTPPDKIGKAILTADTLTKMNGLIFNGKAPQISSSATKSNIIKLPNTKSLISSASKIPIGRKDVISSASKMPIGRKDEERRSKTAQAKRDEDAKMREREDARKKKEAILEAKREYNKRKREEKMAAAAAARSAAERERQLALEAAQRGKTEKQAHADMNKLERMMEAEKKKLELNRKAAETEERRRAEERARAMRLAEEQRAHTARTKQIEESQASKKEAVLMAKEIEKRQKEYIEKQKLKQKLEAEKQWVSPHLPVNTNIPPVYMADGFEHLNSDDDDDDGVSNPAIIPPSWSTHTRRCQSLKIQQHIKQEMIDNLFSTRVHSPDLRSIFPNIDRRCLKRTSSAVWRTPPNKVYY